MSNHMKFAASSAHRWMACPGSYRVMKLAPYQLAGPAAREGTAVHAMIEHCIKSKTFDARDLSDFKVLLNTKGDFEKFLLNNESESNGYTILVSEKMIRGAQICLDLVSRIMDKRPNAFVYTEIKSQVIPDELGGTADIVIVDNSWGAVIDYKNGRGHVDVEDNEQEQIYAIGVNLLFPSVEDWTLAIVQPNDQDDPNPVRTWKTNKAKLQSFKRRCVESMGRCKAAYQDPDNPEWYIPGNHCRWCPGKRSCVAVRKLALKALGSDLPDLPDLPTQEIKPVPVAELTNDQLSWVLKHRKLIIKWLDELVAEEAITRAKEGLDIAGYKLVRKRKNREVSDQEGLETAAKASGWDIWKRALRPLGELDKQVPKSELAKYVTKPQGEIEIAPESDKRPAIETTEGL